MDKFEYEKQLILNRLNKDFSDLYHSRNRFMKNNLEFARNEVELKSLTSELIKDVKEQIKEYCGIDFTLEETEGFLKLHSNLALTLIENGLDTDSSDSLFDSLFDWILFEMPSPVHGHKLSYNEVEGYFKLLKDTAQLYGFKTIY